MPGRFQVRIKRGFVLLSTVFIGVICIMVVLIVFKLQLQSRSYTDSFMFYIIDEDVNYRNKEILLTRLNNYINSTIVPLEPESLCNFLSTNDIKINTEDKKSELSYDRIKNCFIIKYYVDDYFHKEDTYIFNVLNHKIYFIYKGSLYIEGRLVLR